VNRRVQRCSLGILVASALAIPQTVSACATCFGASDGDLAKGMNMGILCLLAVVVFVLSGFAAFFVYLAKRSAAISAIQEETVSVKGTGTQS
jgi:hypothetical protein